MKKFFITFCCLLVGLSCYSASKQYMRTPIPVVGDTLVPVDMQAMVIGKVYGSAARTTDRCRKIMLTNTEVTAEPSNLLVNKRGKYISGSWSENWTVNACGQEVIIPVNFLYDKHGLNFSL